MTDALQAFRDVDFNYVRPLDSVWTDAPFDVDDLNRQVLASVMAEFTRQTRDPAKRPIGQVVIGTAGIGKTHLVGRLRQRVWEDGGWFVLLDIVGLKDFWTSAALCFANALQQRMPDGDTQGAAILRAIARTFNVEAQVREALDAPGIDLGKLIDILLGALTRQHGFVARQHADVFRALVLFCSHDYAAGNFAYGWLQGMPGEPERARELGFLAAQRPPADLVRGLSWIMSLTGPTLTAVDQIDALVHPSGFAAPRAGGDGLDEESPLAEVLAAGLIELHDTRHRGMTVMTCLEASWQVLRERSLQSFLQRFASPRLLLGLEDAGAVARLIANRLAPAYAEAGYAPPYATWPFTPRAVESAVQLLPRQILMRCEDHRRWCADAERVTECETLVEPTVMGGGRVVEVKPERNREAALLARLREEAAVAPLFDDGDDASMGALIRDALDLYKRQLSLDEAIDVENRGDPQQAKPPLHGRLTFTFHREGDRERHYCFRAIEHANAIAFQSRLKAALTASGIDAAIGGRALVVIRRAPVPGGAKTAYLHAAFLKAGGLIVDPTDDDLKTVLALRMMRDRAVGDGEPDRFDVWMRAEQPLCGTALFRDAGLCPPPRRSRDESGEPPVATPPGPATTGSRTSRAAVSEPVPDEPVPTPPVVPPSPTPRSDPPTALPVGHRLTPGAEPVGIPLRLLPRHTAIIAGSGSGKTVLLRRIVEEAALAGIPAIVVDPNNDLSRLGEPWPARPDGFTADDDAKAARYADAVETVVWTPGVSAGKPLALSVLPDFASLGRDPDEREQAVAMAVETVGPLAGAKTSLRRGVLSAALARFADRGGSLADFVALLADLPDGVTAITKAQKFAGEMADELRASVANNALLRADGPPLDPARLFFGSDPSRTRVSVVNLAGLASEDGRQDFVNRLQMTLFGWIKAHPSRTGLLYVLDEAQLFIPATQSPSSRLSGVQLVTQARKYGLGLIVATQAPRGIDNKVVSNCTTQLFGRQSAPATIGAAQEIIAASGGRADDIGRLKAGEFYFSTEGFGKPGKIRTPLCLTHHPANPPTPEEVVARARRGTP